MDTCAFGAQAAPGLGGDAFLLSCAGSTPLALRKDCSAEATCCGEQRPVWVLGLPTPRQMGRAQLAAGSSSMSREDVPVPLSPSAGGWLGRGWRS